MVRAPKVLDDLLQLGHPLLYEKSAEVKVPEELSKVSDWASDLSDVVAQIRATYGFGRAIAAPQLGIMKRLVYMDVSGPEVLINPIILEASTEMFDVWDDETVPPPFVVPEGTEARDFITAFQQQML
ncbi:MAG: peptide deformylase, partial [Saprospiraceae bacterium]|nr:peptide deformylase [Saprospiraceae bacterium]